MSLAEPQATRRALTIIGAFALARLGMMLALPLGRDEAYTIVVSRRLALSYYDHPPLHQWLTHCAALALGETVLARLPFVLLFALTGWLVYAMTRSLYGARAGLIALFALNVTPFFFVSPGGWIVPDGPLLAALAAAALALSRLLLGAPGRREAWILWLAVGGAFGLAFASKYTAALPALGIVGFLALAPTERRWLRHPAPYVAALVALALAAPAFVWNAEHDWISFRFQAARGAPDSRGGLGTMIVMMVGQIGFLTPWIFAGLAAAAASAARAAWRGDHRAGLLIALAAPPIVFFTVAPLWSKPGMPHWAMPGWFFLYPLLGAWLAEPAQAHFALRRWAAGSAALLPILAAFALTQVDFGWVERVFHQKIDQRTLQSLDWRELANSAAFNPRPDFVVVTRWWEGGKAGVALGPSMPIFVTTNEARGLAFLYDIDRFVGHDGVIVVERARLDEVEMALSDYFEGFGEPTFVALGRGGRDEIDLAVAPAHGLTRAFGTPYPEDRF